jgi:hypothetical protein
MQFKLPQGTGSVKHTRPYKTLTPNQKLVHDLVYDDVNGPLFFAENCCYVNRNGLEKYQPFDYQREMIFNMHSYKRLISLFSRQNGKTITTAIYLLWFAMKYEHKDILICAQSKDASMENLSKIKMAYEYCPDFVKKGLISDNKSTLEFDNGSRIAVRAANIKAPRGLSPAIVYVDEFAFIGSQDSADKALQLQQEFYAALTPSLSATGGKLFITFLFDSVFTLCIRVLITYIVVKTTNLSIYYVYFISEILEVIKIVIGTILVKKGIWIQSVSN